MADKPVTQDELKKKVQELYKFIEDNDQGAWKEMGRIDQLRADLEKRVQALEKKCN
jgi:hypothetical protein